ncbi:hypothetical protein LP420_04095 [Massilia sp. B-10]|nr:hypothetical protein LP420_04095 [Massilia sp. B-10]
MLTEQDQPQLSKYSIAVRSEINLAKLRTTLRANSEAGKAAPVSNSEMVYVFVAREAASVKSFDARGPAPGCRSQRKHERLGQRPGPRRRIGQGEQRLDQRKPQPRCQGRCQPQRERHHRRQLDPENG